MKYNLEQFFCAQLWCCCKSWIVSDNKPWIQAQFPVLTLKWNYVAWIVYLWIFIRYQIILIYSLLNATLII